MSRLKVAGAEYTQEEVEENRRIWLEALESGEYKQTREVLRDGTGFCCLGVACAVLGADITSEFHDDDVVYDENGKEVNVTYSGYHYDNEDAIAPRRVMEALGLRDAEGQYGNPNEYGQRISLANRNDGGMTFKEIAGIIRIKPDGLFTR